MSNHKKSLFWGFLAFTVMIWAVPATAHKVHLFCEYVDSKVCCRGWFAKNAPAMNAKLTVKDKSGQKVFSGKTDKRGKVCFTTSAKPPLKAEINAGGGHISTYLIEADE